MQEQLPRTPWAAMEVTIAGIQSTERSAILGRRQSVNCCMGPGMRQDDEGDLK